MADLKVAVGDVLEFPAHALGSHRPTGRYSVEHTQGLPGKFRVTAIAEDGTVSLEPLREGRTDERSTTD